MTHFFFDEQTWEIVVDYSLSLSQMIDACCFRLANPDINPGRFKLNGQGIHRFNLRLLCFESDTELTTQAILTAIRESRMRPAKLEELLALAAVVPHFHLQKHVYALGTSWTNDLIHYPGCSLFRRQRMQLMPIRREPCWDGFSACFACVPL